MNMNAQRQHNPAESGPAGPRERRVRTLKSLVERSVYDIPSEDVAASIIRDTFVFTMSAAAPQR